MIATEERSHPMRISIIVPVYNVADYLQACADSILANDCTDCEVIFIDDGSTDGRSGQLCDEIAAQHPNFMRVVHQENGGLGAARNTGIAEAKGEYLLFVDADDTIVPTALSTLCAAILETPADVYSFPIYRWDGVKEPVRLETSAQFPSPFCLAQQPEFLLSLPAACARLWRRELFAEIQFPDRVWYEDIRTSPKLFASAKSIVTLTEPLYCYLARTGSIMRNTNIARCREILDAFDDLLDWFSAKDLLDAYRPQLCRLAIDHVLIAASVRVARVDWKSPLLAELSGYMDAHFPEYPSNRYLSGLPRNNRLAYRLIVKKHYRLLATLFAIKDRLF